MKRPGAFPRRIAVMWWLGTTEAPQTGVCRKKPQRRWLGGVEVGHRRSTPPSTHPRFVCASLGSGGCNILAGNMPWRPGCLLTTYARVSLQSSLLIVIPHTTVPQTRLSGTNPKTQGVRVFVLQLIVVRPAAAYIAVKMAKAATELLETRVGILCTPLETNAAAAYFDGLCVDKGLRVAVRCRRRPSCSFRIRSHQPWCCRRAHVLRAGQGFCVRRRRGGGPCLPPERLPPASKC